MLNERGIQHTIKQDPEALEKIRASDQHLSETPASRKGYYISRGDFVYLELAEGTDMDALYPALEKFGFVPQATGEHAELLQSAEYHCLHCDYTSDHAGECPTHKEQLLEYSEWLDTQFKMKHQGRSKGTYIALTVFIVVILFMYLRNAKLI